jgi:hypothetical protein
MVTFSEIGEKYMLFGKRNWAKFWLLIDPKRNCFLLIRWEDFTL